MAGDLAIGDRPLANAPHADWRQVLSIVRERQRAANGLMGQETLYSDITCDT